MNLQFKMHGNYKFSIEDNIFIVDITGPCNKEFFDGLHQGMVQTVAQSQLVNFATLVVLRGDAVIINEIFNYHVEFLKSVAVELIAVNLKYCETSALTEIMCYKAYTNAGIKHKFFTDNQMAKNWLNNELNSV